MFPRYRAETKLTIAKDPYKSKKGMPLETKNTQNHENRRLGLIEQDLVNINASAKFGLIPNETLTIIEDQNCVVNL